MISPAKIALPIPLQQITPQPTLGRSLQGGGATLFSAPAGFLMTSQLAVKLFDRQEPILWLRVGREDRDPGILLAGLVTAVESIFPGAGAPTLVRMRQHPGPREGWAPLYAGLARDLDYASGPGSGRTAGPLESEFSLVIEHIDALGGSQRGRSPAGELLLETFLPLLHPTTIRILTRHAAQPRGTLPGYIVQRGPEVLRLDQHSVLSLAEHAGVRLSTANLRRFAALADGRGAALNGLFAAAQELGSETLGRAVQSVSSHTDLLARVARSYLDVLSPQAGELLALALRIEYLHPALVQAVFSEAVELPGEWLQPLSGSWARLRCTWHEPLNSILRSDGLIQRDSLERAAGFLLGQGAFQQAIPLLMELDQPEQAARALIQVAEPLLDYGQWDTLGMWLEQIPQEVRHGWPWLVYTEGELAAARGESRTARRVFAVSSRMFRERGDLKGACQSLLTESCLAAWQNEPDRARKFAEQAKTLAEQASLLWHEGWATWQLGSLAFITGQTEEALRNFSQSAAAAAALEDVQMAAFVGQARHLAQAQVEAEQNMRLHEQAFASAQLASAEAGGRLRLLLANPTLPAGRLLSQYGWSRTPLFLKVSPAHDDLPVPERLLGLLRGLLGQNSPPLYPTDPESELFPPAFSPALKGGGGTPGNACALPATTMAPTANVAGRDMNQEAHPQPFPFPVTGISGTAAGLETSGIQSPMSAPALQPPMVEKVTTAHESSPAGSASGVPRSHPELLQNGQENQPSSMGRQAGAEVISSQAQPPLASNQQPASEADVHAYMLGDFRIIVNDQLVEAWPGGRGKAIFAYLLTQYYRPVARDVLMDTFWPDASPEAARNSLNVAIYSLRQGLKAVYNHPVILFHENAYRIDPALSIWLDFSVFEQHILAGRQFEDAGQPAAAIPSYQTALNLYQGDFLVDIPYEDWAVVERERLRVLYLETLDRLSLIYFIKGQYAASANLCQRMLSSDSCREDAHCRLMRCYSRQGQSSLALRQFQACVEALRTDLDVSPSPATIQLYEQIRRREMV